MVKLPFVNLKENQFLFRLKLLAYSIKQRVAKKKTFILIFPPSTLCGGLLNANPLALNYSCKMRITGIPKVASHLPHQYIYTVLGGFAKQTRKSLICFKGQFFSDSF